MGSPDISYPSYPMLSYWRDLFGTLPQVDAIMIVPTVFITIGQALMWIVAIITVISGVKYLVDNKEVISDM